MAISIKNMTEDEIFNVLLNLYNTDGMMSHYFELEMPDGVIARIDPYEWSANHEDCKWFFVEGIEDRHASCDSLRKLANYFANYTETITGIVNTQKELAEMRERILKMDRNSDEFLEEYSSYSDRYKEVYGVRPRFLCSWKE